MKSHARYRLGLASSNIARTAMAGALLAGLTACGGSSGGGSPTGGGGNSGGGTPPVTGTGTFKDSNVSGLGYESGDENGMTSASGEFTYEVGENVTFSVGGVTVGTAAGQELITPIDLVSGGNSTNMEVLNITRFLHMLDTDNNPDNGIAVSSDVQTIAENWADVDFSTTDLDAELVLIVSDVASVDARTPALPDAATARAHLESTVRCVRAGGYTGTFAGDDNGPFGVLVDAETGLLSGFAYSNADLALLSLNGMTAVSFDQEATFISGDASSGATFSGEFTSPDDIEGTWELAPDTGTFSGSRIGGAANAAYRFTGSFEGDAIGLFTFDVDAADDVTGVAYTLYAQADGTIDELSEFSGELSGTALTATVEESGSVDATISGTLDKALGTLTGTWSDADGNAGTFSGRGCRLN